MAYQPKLSEDIESRVEEWMENNPHKDISEKNKAIEHLLKKALGQKIDNETEEAIREIVREELEEKP
jgi:hypothetical protein